MSCARSDVTVGCCSSGMAANASGTHHQLRVRNSFVKGMVASNKSFPDRGAVLSLSGITALDLQVGPRCVTSYFSDYFVRFPEVAFAALFCAFVFGAVDLLTRAGAKCLLTLAAS